MDYVTLFFNGYMSKMFGFAVTDEARRIDVSKKSHQFMPLTYQIYMHIHLKVLL